MDTLSVDDRVGTGEINVLKDAGGNILSIGKTIGLKCPPLYDNHLARQYVTHKHGSVNLKSTGLRG